MYIINTSAQNETGDKDITVNVYWRQTAYMRVIEQVITNLEEKFSAESLQLAMSIDNFLSLNFQNGMFFISPYKAIINYNIMKI